jgi:hypothetical protein
MDIIPFQPSLIENEMASTDFSTQTRPIVEESGRGGLDSDIQGREGNDDIQ